MLAEVLLPDKKPGAEAVPVLELAAEALSVEVVDMGETPPTEALPGATRVMTIVIVGAEQQRKPLIKRLEKLPLPRQKKNVLPERPQTKSLQLRLRQTKLLLIKRLEKLLLRLPEMLLFRQLKMQKEKLLLIAQ
jgi:hypothetical protein